MNLAEEYCKRHSLRCPVIKRADSSLNLIFRANYQTWLSHWVVFQIQKHHESYHPSFYYFNWLIPQHNGSFHGGPLSNLSNSIRVDWDNYDIEIIKAAQRDDGIVPVGNLAEAKLAAWQIFLFCADEKIATLPMDIRCLIYESVAKDTSLEDQMVCQQAVIDYFYNSGSNLVSRWDNIRTYCDPANYGSWLADLVVQMRDPDYRDEFSDMQSVA